MDIYNLYRQFWNFAFENPEIIKPNDIAIFAFAIEHCNRLGWKEKFGFPTTMVMEATGIKSYSVYKKHLDNLINWGFIKMVEQSKNQYSSNIIALEENYKANYEANDKALDKAFIKHGTKQNESTVQSTVQSIDSINKPIYNNTNLPINNNILLEKETKEDLLSEAEFSEEVEPEKEERKKVALKKERFSPPTVQEVQEYCNERQNGIQAYAFVNFYQSKGWFIGKNKMKDWRAAIRTWENKNKENENGNTKTNAGSSASEGKSRFSKFTVDDFIIPTENY